MTKQKNISRIALLVLIAIRFLAQVVIAFSALNNSSANGIFAILAVVYLLAFLGIIRNQKWGMLLIVIVALADLTFASLRGGASGIGAIIFDLILIVLTVLLWRQLKNSPAQRIAELKK